MTSGETVQKRFTMVLFIVNSNDPEFYLPDNLPDEA